MLGNMKLALKNTGLVINSVQMVNIEKGHNCQINIYIINIP